MTKASLNKISVCSIGLALVSSACIARGADDYRTVTRQLVDTQQADIQACFGEQPGKVVVNFTVEKKTGKISNPSVDSAKSSAGDGVGECIVAKIDGLALAQPDMRDGAASFTWELSN